MWPSATTRIASPPDDAGHVELTLDHVEGGEVSGWFHTVAKPGDEVEVRGPLSGFFAWPGDRPALLIGAGSGVVPLMSMLRHHRARGLDVPLRLLVSARGPEELIYAREYGERDHDRLHAQRAGGCAGGTYGGRTCGAAPGRAAPGGWEAYVCGSNGFAEHASRLLVEAGPAGGPDPDRALRLSGSAVLWPAWPARSACLPLAVRHHRHRTRGVVDE